MQAAAPPEVLSQIAGLARSGRMDEAAVLVENARHRSKGDPVLAALGGAIEFHRGKFDRAVPLLREAHASKPDDITVRANLAEALFRTDDTAAALALCDAASCLADRSLRLARLGGFLAQQAEDFETAIERYRHVVTVDPNDWSSWNNLGNSYSSIGKFADAVESLDRAVKLAPDSQPIRVNLGNILLARGDLGSAEIVLKEAAENDPTDHVPLLSLFTLYRKSGREDDAAYDAMVEAVGRKPEDAKILDEAAHEASRVHKYDEAIALYWRAIEAQPGMGSAYTGLASVFDRVNREAELEPLRARAVAEAAPAQHVEFVDALRYKREGQIEEAFAALERSGEVVGKARRMHLRGTMLDRIGRHEEAFEAFVEMNQHAQDDPGEPRARGAEYRNYVRTSCDLLTPEWVAGWSSPPSPDPARPSPIFLAGFPRSGTTLLDTMLMADPRALVLEEEPFIAELERAVGGVEALASLDEAALVSHRASYWERVAERGALTPETIVIDKQPLHANKIQTIMRFFPDARIILALRHPCDVLLSCFLTNFKTNHAMSNFLDLHEAAELYDMTFRQLERAKEVFGFRIGTVVYERLVEDKTRELRPLFEWLGMEWPGDEADHRDAARARGVVRTASYSQVTEPLYKRAAGRWTRYRAQLEPIIPVLKPWIDKFGYSLDDGRHPDWPEPWQAQ
jgi:Flp pilus assembly protein TadD